MDVHVTSHDRRVQETIRTRSGPPPVGLPGKLQAADKKEEQHLAFSERSRRVRTQCPFDASNFVQPFIRYFFFCYPSKIPRHFIDIIFFFLFIQNKISIYMILSFLTMYRSAKKSTFYRLEISHAPPLSLFFFFAVGSGERWAPPRPTPLTAFTWPRRQSSHKVIKYAACFPTWPNFQGE